MTAATTTKIKYSSFKYLAIITIWLDVDTQHFGFAINGIPTDCPHPSKDLAEKAARQTINKLKKEAKIDKSFQIDAKDIHS